MTVVDSAAAWTVGTVVAEVRRQRLQGCRSGGWRAAGCELRCRGALAWRALGDAVWGLFLAAVVLQAEEDCDQDEHHDEERLVVAAALLIGVFELCQKRLPILY